MHCYRQVIAFIKLAYIFINCNLSVTFATVISVQYISSYIKLWVHVYFRKKHEQTNFDEDDIK